MYPFPNNKISQHQFSWSTLGIPYCTRTRSQPGQHEECNFPSYVCLLFLQLQYERLYPSTNQVTLRRKWLHPSTNQTTFHERAYPSTNQRTLHVSGGCVRVCFSKTRLIGKPRGLQLPFVSVRLPAVNPARHAVNLPSSAEHAEVATRGQHPNVIVLPVQTPCHGSSRRCKSGGHRGGEMFG